MLRVVWPERLKLIEGWKWFSGEVEFEDLGYINSRSNGTFAYVFLKPLWTVFM